LENGRAGKGIIYHVFVAFKELERCSEFGKERKVALLPSGKGGRLFADNSQRGFVLHLPVQKA
jgi:hypothetical protein